MRIYFLLGNIVAKRPKDSQKYVLLVCHLSDIDKQKEVSYSISKVAWNKETNKQTNKKVGERYLNFSPADFKAKSFTTSIQ